MLRASLGSAALIVLTLLGEPASAALTRYISSSGTSSGAGTVNITIETFSKPGWPGPNSTYPLSPTPPTYFTSVPIPASYNAAQTTFDIRDSVDSVLGVDYTVTIVSSTYVKIDRPGSGTFTMLVQDMVPGQVIEESSGPGGGTGGIGGAALSIPETVALALIALLVCLVTLPRTAGRRGDSGS